MNIEKFEEILSYKSLHEIFKIAHEKNKELHSEEFIGFYAKSVLNNNQAELFYFYTDHIVQVQFTKDEHGSYIYKLNFTQYNEKVVNKSIIMKRTNYDPMVLNINLENGTSFEFNNINDSNDDWYELYAENILSLYKLI